MVDFEKLKAPFPQESISWRAQSVTQDGTKALALAYVDARDVMNRLDDICGPAGWQCKYSHANGKTVCDIAVKVSDEWIWKADGAGDSDIEAEKGALSDAFKRAAVRWGIGRYLYDLGSPWVPCESYKQGEKFKWKSFKDDPWNHIKGTKAESKSLFKTHALRKEYCEKITNALNSSETKEELKAAWQSYSQKICEMQDNGNEYDLISIEDLKNVYIRKLTKLKDES